MAPGIRDLLLLFALFSTSTAWGYDVFLSFQGEDTGTSFTDHLFAALDWEGIRTYRNDKEHTTGEPVWTEQVRAIERSKIAVIVFSKNYASSERCLDEAEEIMKLKRSSKQIVLPVFYDVIPAGVRYQKWSFAEAFAKHEERFGEDKVQVWRAALTDAAQLTGWDSQTYRFESKLIEEIVEEISKNLITKNNEISKKSLDTMRTIEDDSPDALPWSTRIVRDTSRSLPILASPFFFLT